jgi:hypothetical protein
MKVYKKITVTEGLIRDSVDTNAKDRAYSRVFYAALAVGHF